MKAKKILSRVIDKAYVVDEGFCFYYNLENDSRREDYINTNDLGDYIPFLDYYGFDDIVHNWIKNIVDKYDVFYHERVERFGSTRLSSYGIIDLYSNSDFYHGLLYARNSHKYQLYFDKIDDMFRSLGNILNQTDNTHFIKILGHYISLPITRLMDTGMYPEIFSEYGNQEVAKKILLKDTRKIIKTKSVLSTSYMFGLKLQKQSTLMKDHTNFLFSYIRYYRNNKENFKEQELDSIVSIIINSFGRNDMLFNTNKQYNYTNSLVFAMFEVLLEAYLMTNKDKYLGLIEKYLHFWLSVLNKYKILPDVINLDLSLKANSASVDTNTDFYVFLKKLELFTDNSYLSNETIISYKYNILNTFIDKDTYDIFSTYNLLTKEKSNIVKSKFSCLFTKIFIMDSVNSKSAYFKSEVYLDDR